MDRLPSSAGIEPEIFLPAISSHFRLDSLPSSAGIEPERFEGFPFESPTITSFSRLDRLPSSAGIEPEIFLPTIFSSSRLDRLPSSAGIEPEILTISRMDRVGAMVLRYSITCGAKLEPRQKLARSLQFTLAGAPSLAGALTGLTTAMKMARAASSLRLFMVIFCFPSSFV